MTHQIIRTPHGDYEIIQTARGYYIQDPFGFKLGRYYTEQEAAKALRDVMGSE